MEMRRKFSLTIMRRESKRRTESDISCLDATFYVVLHAFKLHCVSKKSHLCCAITLTCVNGLFGRNVTDKVSN